MRHKGYTIINITGLSVGLACFLLISLWVFDEWSFDRFHVKPDNLYRVEADKFEAGEVVYMPITPTPLQPYLKETLPEIVHATRYSPMGTIIIQKDDNRFHDDQICHVDPDFLKMFCFPLVEGDPFSALSDVSSVVITRSMAEKYFGENPPIGEILIIDEKEYIVSGVLEDIPDNTHFQFDGLLPFATREERPSDNIWYMSGLYTYIQLDPAADPGGVQEKLRHVIRDHHAVSKCLLYLQPLTRIHLFHGEHLYIPAWERAGEIKYVIIFSVLGLFLLVVACVNFMNLATARSSKRAQEIGVRKIVGATKSNMTIQFLSESVVLAFLALFCAIALVELALPAFNDLSGKSLDLKFTGAGTMLPYMLFVAVMTGILAGLYPALYLAALHPEKVLKSYQKSGRSNVLFRRILVIGQITLSVVALIGTAVIYRQLNYVRNSELGFDKDYLMYMSSAPAVNDKYETIKNELIQYPNILAVTRGSLPTESVTATHRWEWEGKNPDEEVQIHPMMVDYDYIEILGLEILQGRSFNREFTADENGFVVNEEAVEIMGFMAPVGQVFTLGGRKGTVLGVVKDFHYGSLHKKIGPAVLTIKPVGHVRPWHRYICVKIKPTDVRETISFIETTWKKHTDSVPFRYRFLDDTIGNFYRTEYKIDIIVRVFAAIAIFVSCLGLFGLAAFAAELRTKEIGIRKTLGATVTNIARMMTREYLYLVVIANVIAWPVAYYLMNRWLEGFAYRTRLGWDIFLVSGALALIIALLSVGFQAIRAATADPVKSLRYE